MQDKKLLTLEEIIDNAPREIVVEGLDRTVKIRDPSNREKIEAKELAKKDPRWNDMTESERNGLVLEFIALKMLIDPKISVDEYYNANSVKLSTIINAVVLDYTSRILKLHEPMKRELDAFLEQKMVRGLENTTTS